MYLCNRHRQAKGVIFRYDTQKLIGRFLKANTDPLKNSDGGAGTPADDVGDVSGAAAALFGGLLIAELISGANLEERRG